MAHFSERVAETHHGVVDEGDEGEVNGEGVPPGGKGGLPLPVPEEPQSLPPPPGHSKTQKSVRLSATHSTQTHGISMLSPDKVNYSIL